MTTYTREYDYDKQFIHDAMNEFSEENNPDDFNPDVLVAIQDGSGKIGDVYLNEPSYRNHAVPCDQVRDFILRNDIEGLRKLSAKIDRRHRLYSRWLHQPRVKAA